MTSLTTSKAWQALQTHHQQLRDARIGNLFQADPARFDRFSLKLPGMLFDYSKNMLIDETVKLLTDLAQQQNLAGKRDDMFAGALINNTEKRAAWHVALRSKTPPPAIEETFRRMHDFATAVRNDFQITDIVNIGIGGSRLGPELACGALAPFHHPRLRVHFVSNVDPSDLENVLKSLSPKSTLFIIGSKTFTTTETMQNALRAKEWFYTSASAPFNKRFVAVCANTAAAERFGITKHNIYPMEEWVGGRYSVWSSVGLAVMIMVGPQNFRAFLAGACAMDTHFREAPLDQNMPVIAGLISIWHRNFFNYPGTACIPYHSGLHRLAAWMQQLEMESNGKSVDKDGADVGCATSPLIFGEPGTDAQHSFFQWLHQGTTPTPVEFVGAVKSAYSGHEQQVTLLSNLLAQSETLMNGKMSDEPHRRISGNRPSSTILLDELSPTTLGMLLAFYEHKTFVEGAIWNINSFDQWGVEAGKAIATQIQRNIATDNGTEHDGSTAGLIHHINSIL